MGHGKLTCLGSEYKIWANISKNALDKMDDILNIMEDIETPDKIKKYFTQLGMRTNHFLLLLPMVPLAPWP